MFKLMVSLSKIKKLGVLALTLAAVSLGAFAPSLAVADGIGSRFFETGARDKTDGAWLGVQVQTVTDDLASRFNLQVKEGVYVSTTVDASPAEEAGVRPGDVIIEYNYRKVTSSRELAEFVSENESGDEVILFVDRDGSKKRLIAHLKDRPTEKTARIQSLTPPDDRASFGSDYRVNTVPYIGVALQTITGQLADYFAVPGGAGALITETLEGSPAAEAGLKAGDVVIAADGAEIDMTEDLQRVVRERESGDKIEITVIRNKTKTVLSVIVAERELSQRGFGAPGLFGYNEPSADGMHPFGMPMRGFASKRGKRTLEPLNLPDVVYSRTQKKSQRIDTLEKQIQELKEQIESMQKRDDNK